jgi:hypothetical protein
MNFATWAERFDPNDSKEYTFRFALRPGEMIVGTPTVDIVDSLSGAVDGASDMSATNVTFGVLVGDM